MGRNSNGKPSTTDRLMGRASGLSSKKMADGGEVFQGALASKALKAVGARAMTMDGTIFVNEGFGGTAEDVALYAHEKTHQDGSGAHDKGDHNHGNDPEEMAARAVERMVLHRAKAGEDLGEILAGIKQDSPQNQEEAEKQIHHALSKDKEDSDRAKEMMGYWAMRAQGYSDTDIRRVLAEFVVERVSEIQEMNQARADGNATF